VLQLVTPIQNITVIKMHANNINFNKITVTVYLHKPGKYEDCNVRKYLES